MAELAASVAQRLRNLGVRAEAVTLHTGRGSGCQGHPDAAGHQRAAQELARVLRTLLQW
jgi:hypothetical protein